MKPYRLNGAGRRNVLILVVATLLLGAFAAWTLQSVLGFRYLDFAATAGATLERGLSAAQLIPAAILIAMLVAAPLLLWSLCEEWATSYTVRDDGLVYETVAGLKFFYPWSAVRVVREPDAPDAIAEVITEPVAGVHAGNPLLRWLHRQAVGADRVPIYPGVEARDELLAEIVERAGLRAADLSGDARRQDRLGGAPAEQEPSM